MQKQCSNRNRIQKLFVHVQKLDVERLAKKTRSNATF